MQPSADIIRYAIYLDLDGVLADYAAGITAYGFKPDPARKNEYLRSGTDDPFKRSMFEAIKGTEFFRHLPLCPGALDLYRYVKESKPMFLTAAPLFGASQENYFLNPHWLGASYHKRAWVEHTLLPRVTPKLTHLLDESTGAVQEYYADRVSIEHDDYFICTTSFKKQEFIGRKHSDHQILIDDRRDNCVRWARAGGVAIIHTSAEKTIATLAAYMEYGAAMREAFTIVPFGGMIAGLDTSVRTWAELSAAADRNID